MADYRGGPMVSRPMDGGDPRTPMAWQHRDQGVVQEGHPRGYPVRGPDAGTPSSRRTQGQSSERGTSERGARRGGYSRSKSRDSQGGGYNRSQSSPSTTEDTTETDSQTVVGEESRQMVPGYPVMVGYPVTTGYPGYPGTGSLRSVHSVPILHPVVGHSHTWDGEPCPVHHHHGHHGHHGPMVPLSALHGMGPAVPVHGYPPPMSLAYSVPPSVISGATTVRRARSVAELPQQAMRGPPLDHTDRQSLHASMASLSHASMPGYGHKRNVISENGAPSRLPVRSVHGGHVDQTKVFPVPKKKQNKGLGCCSGHFVVIWIILSIITFGVLLGVLLKFTVS